MIEIKAPDGAIIQFPDGTDDATIEGVMKSEYGGAKDSGGGLAKAYGVGVAEGAVGLAGIPGDSQSMGSNISSWLAGKLGASPETQNALRQVGRVTMSPIGVTSAKAPTSAQIKSAVEGVTGEFYKPQTTAEEYANTIGQFTPGAFAGPGGVVQKAGGLLGGAIASEAAGQATKGTDAEPYARLAGGVLGGAGGGLLGAKAVSPQMAKPAIQELDQLRAAKDAAYRAVDNSGARYSDTAINDMIQRIDNKWASMSFNPVRHDKAMAFVPQLQKLYNSSPSLTELDQFRQVAYRDSVQGVDDANAEFGKIILKEIDKLIDGASQNMMAQGDPAMAAALVNQARKTNKVYKASEEVMGKLDKSERQALKTGKGTNQDNALRQKVDELINQGDGDFYKRQPKTVQDKMQEIVRGTKPRNFARSLGAAAPSGIVSATGGGAIGAWLGSLLGPAGTVAGAIGVPAVGYVSKKIADKSTQNAVKDLLRLIQANGSVPQAGLSPRKGLAGQAVPQGLLGGYSASIPQRAGLLPMQAGP